MSAKCSICGMESDRADWVGKTNVQCDSHTPEQLKAVEDKKKAEAAAKAGTQQPHAAEPAHPPTPPTHPSTPPPKEPPKEPPKDPSKEPHKDPVKEPAKKTTAGPY